MNNNFIDFKNTSILAINLDKKQPNNYETCIRRNIYKIEDILKLSIEDIKYDFNESFVRLIHSYGLYFDYEEKLINELSSRINHNEIIPIKDFKYLLDLNYKLPIELKDSNGILMRLKLLKKLNGLTSHDIEVIEKIFNINMNDIIKELDNMSKDPILDTKLNKIPIPTIAVNVLSMFKINTLGTLILLSSEEDLMSFRNIGVGITNKIIDVVHSMGYKFADETFNKIEISKEEILLNEINQLMLERKLLLQQIFDIDVEMDNKLKELNNLNTNKLVKFKKRY